LFVTAPTRAELAPIQLDGLFEDWAAVSLMASDNPNDGGTVDFADVWVANDQDFLYIRFETGGEVQPDEQQDIRLYIDTDLNAGTGTSFGGIGAELVWELGNRNGSFKGSAIDHPDIGLLIGPTVSNTEFELALRRDATPNGSALFPGNQLRFILRDASSGDTVPNSGGITYTFTAGSDVAPTLSLAKTDPEDIRVTGWNVQNDGLFDGGSSAAAQNRLLDAIDPDVLILCEVWNHDANETRAIIEQHLPSGVGENWYSVKRDNGNVIVSRFAITDSWEVNPGYRITAALLELGAAYPTDLLVIANHWRCCTADNDRQEEADSVIEFLADARTPGGVITLPADTPIVLAGDFNLVGWRQQLETILTGDIINQGLYGPDSPPDWDGTDLAVPPSRHPDGRAGDTWRNPFSSFYPGVLDWIFYTDSAATLKNHFILETRTMLAATLSANGLFSGDTFTSSDHAPRVADFSLVDPASAVPDLGGRYGARLLPNVPNPFNPATELRFALDRAGDVELAVYDARGRLVRAFAVGPRESGAHSVLWDGTDQSGQPVASGVYHVQLVTRVGSEAARDVRSVVLVE
jgi:endonuclease/exonuclease/phosphatase family metal-dependent hydrolase